MSALPVCSGNDAIRAFAKVGWVQDRQKGSHVTMKRADSTTVLTVPLHRELGKGLLRKLINQSGLTVDEFVNNL
jgi:predicted RNA binding protein YcfA (HicA-like mRNA interferase family)